MDTVGALLLGGLGLYVSAGLVIGIAFVTFGVTRVLPQPTSVTLGARVLLLPGAAALWPYVLARWLRCRSAR